VTFIRARVQLFARRLRRGALRIVQYGIERLRRTVAVSARPRGGAVLRRLNRRRSIARAYDDQPSFAFLPRNSFQRGHGHAADGRRQSEAGCAQPDRARCAIAAAASGKCRGSRREDIHAATRRESASTCGSRARPAQHRLAHAAPFACEQRCLQDGLDWQSGIVSVSAHEQRNPSLRSRHCGFVARVSYGNCCKRDTMLPVALKAVIFSHDAAQAGSRLYGVEWRAIHESCRKMLCLASWILARRMKISTQYASTARSRCTNGERDLARYDQC